MDIDDSFYFLLLNFIVGFVYFIKVYVFYKRKPLIIVLIALTFMGS